MNNSEEDIKNNCISYAEAFLQAYTAFLDENYAEVIKSIVDMGIEPLHIPHYRRELGKNISISALCAKQNFYLYFVKYAEGKVKTLKIVYTDPNFGDDWMQKFPDSKKNEDVLESLGLTLTDTIGIDIHIGGVEFITGTQAEMKRVGTMHGRQFAEHDGELLKRNLPDLVREDRKHKTKLSFKARYEELCKNKDRTPQVRGIEFEKLWRDVLDFYGWKSKKIKLGGEEDDFTAIYLTSHILGEVRWYKEPMTGDKVRSFSAKLDPRPQTTGLMISMSGFDEGANAVARRVVHSKTIVFFSKNHIEEVIVNLVNPGEVFEEELRKVYDYIFEETDI